ncbi:MAG: ABC transporter permease [Firmicutes bacterium]|nr:ABC transporter permease [Bacillota bacterium]
MGLKKILTLVFVILLLLLSFFYLKGLYNISAIELSFNGKLTMDKFRDLNKELHLEKYSIKYIKKYNGGNLIMTTGNDRKMRDINISRGEFLYDSEKPITVIGEKIASTYFNKYNILGEDMFIDGKEYEIVGIEKDGNDIYIPFDEKKLSEYWDESLLTYIAPYEKTYELSINRTKNLLESQGIKVNNTIVYKEVIRGYINIIILILLYLIIILFKKIYESLKARIKSIIKGYKKKRRVMHLHSYIKKEKKNLLITLSEIVGTLLLFYIIIKICSYLIIPDNMIPANLFSFTDYKDIIVLYYDDIILKLKDGLSDIVVDKFKIYGFIIIIVIMWNRILTYIENKHFKTRNSEG